MTGHLEPGDYELTVLDADGFLDSSWAPLMATLRRDYVRVVSVRTPRPQLALVAPP